MVMLKVEVAMDTLLALVLCVRSRNYSGSGPNMGRPAIV